MREPWKQMRSGAALYILTPRPEDFEITEIAHVLANMPRFDAHTLGDRKYSVGEHSVRVSYACEPADALEGLLHDAPEIVTGDCSQPMKQAMRALQSTWHGSTRSPFDVIEDTIARALAERFGCRWPWPPSVKRADLTLLATEARDLMAPPPISWELPYPPLPERIDPWAPDKSEAEFLARFRELTPAR